MPRPDVALRPVCRYYNTTPRGCFAGNKCHYLHGDPSVQKYAPYEEHKTCRFYAQGYCKRGNECWFKHVEPAAAQPQVDSSVERDDDASCGICFEEKPALYGLLSGCSHAFCLNCIRQWRDPEGKGIDMTDSGIHKTCPMCRISTKFIVPSSRFYPQEDPCKTEVIEKYKQSMARVPCRYFVKSRPGSRFCPFGRDCFYQHANDDGTPYVFPQGVDVMMTRRHRGAHASSDIDPLQAALEVLEGFAETLASDNHGPDDSGTRRAIIDMHVRDMLRIMGHGPALRTLATLERMAGPDDEPVEASSQEQPAAAPVASPPSAEATEDIRPSTPAPPPPRARSTPPVVSSHDDSAFSSEDPRSPHNTSRAGQLTSGDFAWMMEERRGSSEDENCT